MAKNNLHIDITAKNHAGGAFESINNSLKSASGAFSKFKRTVIVSSSIAGIVGLFTKTISLIKKREKSLAALKTVTASQKELLASDNFILSAVNTMPFALQEITDAFVFLRKKGLDPLNSGILTTIGDTASALGLSLEQVSNAIGHAMIGEYSYLKNIGIGSRVSGKNLDLIYYDKNRRRHIDRITNRYDSELINAVIASTLQTKYSGGSANAQAGWAGLNFGNQTASFFLAMGQQGVFKRLKNDLQEWSDAMDKYIARGGMKEVTNNIGDALNSTYSYLEASELIITSLLKLMNPFDSAGSWSDFETRYKQIFIKGADFDSANINRHAGSEKIEVLLEFKNAPPGLSSTTQATNLNIDLNTIVSGNNYVLAR